MTVVAESAAAPAPAKEDPETLVLRGRPRPVVRFRRGLIVGVAAAALSGLVAVAWLALEPPSLRAAAEPQEEPESGGTPDSLAAAPSGYGQVPQLGPPLPGDLGRPILEQQRASRDDSMLASTAADATAAAALAEERAAMAREAERQRLAAAEQAARSSGVLVRLENGGRSAAAPPGAPPSAPVEQDGNPEAAATGPQARKMAFARSGSEDVSAERLTPPASPWTLAAGSVIPASLVSGLNSDLPGMVLAQVTEHVRDSVTGSAVLVPQGSKLIGSYDSVVAFGQRRALLVWRRLVLPDGSSIRLDSMPATDLSGYAGVADRVDFHTWRLLTGIAMSTLLGVGTELSIGGESDLVRALRESAQQDAARAGDQLTKRNLDVQPTLTVRPGWPVRALVHKDLVLRPWKDQQ